MNLKKISILVFGLICISGYVAAQSAVPTPNPIQSQFSQESIEAYQESSESKLVTFFEYLTLYSTTKDENLKKQLKQNLYSLIESENTSLADFTDANLPEITLPYLLPKIENNYYHFSIQEEIFSDEPEPKNWTNYYELMVKQGNEAVTYSLGQEILFTPIEKKFGSKSKTVWEMKLGDITIE